MTVLVSTDVEPSSFSVTVVVVVVVFPLSSITVSVEDEDDEPSLYVTVMSCVAVKDDHAAVSVT